jgi:biopolymer transport protein ExbB
MKKFVWALALALTIPMTAAAQDMREAARKAEADQQATLQRAAEVEAKIVNDRAALLAQVAGLEAQKKQLEGDIKALLQRKETGRARHEVLNDKWTTREVEFREISGNVRITAKDIEALLNQSQLTALYPKRLEAIEPILSEGYFADIDDISGMITILLDEMKRSGEVVLQQGGYVGIDGENHLGDLLTLGKFTAMYREGKDTGFLTYSNGKLFAMTTPPPRKMAKAMNRYFEGKSDVVPFDPSSGESLVKVGKHMSIVEEFRGGGPVMWPILVLGLVVVFFTIYKLAYLRRVHGDTEVIMGGVNALVQDGNWNGVDEMMSAHKTHNLVVNVLRAGIGARREDRETVENVLQESILKELPRLERGISVMAVLGAIAPLLGLLGTVTGMIATFKVITLYGTGDPKLMSSGISEALIATKWGLCIAVPTMLIHTLLARRVANVVSDMEEKAVALSNTIQKEQRRGSRVATA